MDVAITIVMLVPVLLAVALIIGVIRRNITERRAGDPVDISGAIPAVIVLMVAVLIIVAMGNAASPYVFDEDSGELTIQKNVPELDVQPWDSYASDVKSLVIEDGVTIGSGAFDSLTSLEYLSIGEGSSLGSGVFGVAFKDATGDPVSPASGEYAGTGDGTLYAADRGVFTYNSSGTAITGLSSAWTSAKYLVLPGDPKVTNIAGNAFGSNSTIEIVLAGASYIKIVESGAFGGCTALSTLVLPDTITEIRTNAFSGTSALEALDLPESAVTIGLRAFQNSGLESVSFSSSVSSILGSAFYGCASVTSVSFASGFAPTLDAAWAGSWTFYASDGTTVIDKTVAANLAGKTFQGVASALVEVAPGQLNLTPQQLQQVQLHTQETQDLDIQPLPFQPTVQTQDQEPVSA